MRREDEKTGNTVILAETEKTAEKDAKKNVKSKGKGGDKLTSLFAIRGSMTAWR